MTPDCGDGFNRRSMLRLGAGGVAAIALGGCSQVFPTRLDPVPFGVSLVVATPEGLRAGLSRLSLQVLLRGDASDSTWMYYTGTLFEATGQAAMVDMGARGILFALLRSNQHVDWATSAPFSRQPRDLRDRQAAEQYAEEARNGWESWDLPRHFPPNPLVEPPAQEDPPTAYPTLVRFRDLNDPLSVEGVDPDRLSDSFGEGVSLRKIGVHVGAPTLAITQAQLGISKPPPQIGQVLPWLRGLGERSLDGSAEPPAEKLGGRPLASLLKRRDFLTGD